MLCLTLLLQISPLTHQIKRYSFFSLALLLCSKHREIYYLTTLLDICYYVILCL
jgi:hypothetical protein